MHYLKHALLLLALTLGIFSSSAWAYDRFDTPINPLLPVETEFSREQLSTLSLRDMEAKAGRKFTLKEKAAVHIAKKKIQQEKGTDGKTYKQLTAFLLCFFVGIIGIHRFYLGHIGIGIAQILTAGGCGIWTLIDFIRIITLDLKAKDGSEMEPWS